MSGMKKSGKPRETVQVKINVVLLGNCRIKTNTNTKGDLLIKLSTINRFSNAVHNHHGSFG